MGPCARWLILVCCSLPTNLPAAETPLVKDAIYDDYLDRHPHVLTSEGEALIIGDRHVYHLRRDGSLRQTLQHDQHIIAGAYFDPDRKIYWVVTLASSLFFGEDGELLGQGVFYNRKGEPTTPFIRYLFGVTRRVFILQTHDLWYQPKPKLLQEVNFQRRSDDQFVIYPIDEPFCTIRPIQVRDDFNHKKHWLVEGAFHEDLYVVNALEPLVQRFVSHEDHLNRKKELSNRRIPLLLPEFVSLPEEFASSIHDWQSMDLWRNSWSRIVGFYGIKGGFLVVYESPLPGDPTRNRVLAQKMTRKGRALGEYREIEGIPLGVWQEELSVLKAYGEKLHLEHLAF